MIKKMIGVGILALMVLATLPVTPEQKSLAQGSAGEATVRGITRLVPLVDTVGQYEKFEAVIEVDADFSNPYDPAEIRLDVTFTSPAGEEKTVPAFYYQDYEQDLSQSPSRLTAKDEWSWRVRFAPDVVGEWAYRVVATAANGSVESETAHFNVVASDSRGFVRIDARNPNYLAFDDGTPYFAVGQNVSWYSSGGMSDYVTWFDKMQAVGANWARVWMASWAFGIEWNDTGLGNYDKRQNRAYQLDSLLEIAKERDIYIMLTLINHGQFNESVDPEWANNPYNAANGGPLENPVEWASNTEALRLWKQRLRYIAARWGYSTNIMSWEWWNEVNWTPMASASILAPWVVESTEFLRSVDPYQHLISHSGSGVVDESVWAHVDITHEHRYNLSNLVQDFNDRVPRWLTRYPDRPFIIGEFGSPNEYDVQGLLVHLGIWAAPMNGALGTGMTWWWDNYIEVHDLYYHFGGAAAYWGGEDMAAYQWTLTESALNDDGKRAARLYGLQSNERARLWVVSKKYSETQLVKLYEDNLRQRASNPLDIQFPEVTEAELMLSGLDDGDYTVEWWDTMAGTILQTETLSVVDGQAVLAVPTFTADVALKVNPAE